MLLNSIGFERDIQIDHIMHDIKATNKKTVFKMLSDKIASEHNLDSQLVEEELIIHEAKTNSTIGEGIAIPDVLLSNIRNSCTILVGLQEPIEFNSLDGEPVDLICLVASPVKDKQHHLRRLSRITRLLRNSELTNKIRETSDSETIQALVHNPDGWMMAA